MSCHHGGSCNQHEGVGIQSYYSEVQPTWCGGCGNYGIWAALKRALVELGLKPHEVLLAFDIGCNGNMSDKIRGYRIHGLHGRVLPLAAAAKIANPRVKVIAMAGDGATYSEGINHFVNSIRNNYPMTFIVHNNGNYGLTTGQASATTPQDAPRTGNIDGPTASTLNPIDLALSLEPSFIARSFSGEIKHMTAIIKEAILHQDKGFSFVDMLQACPTYNHETTHGWYYDRIKDISEYKNYDNTDKNQVRQVSDIYNNEKIAVGVLYKNDKLPSYLNRLEYRNKGIWKNSIPSEEVKKYDVSQLLNKYQ